MWEDLQVFSKTLLSERLHWKLSKHQAENTQSVWAYGKPETTYLKGENDSAPVGQHIFTTTQCQHVLFWGSRDTRGEKTFSYHNSTWRSAEVFQSGKKERL